MIKYLILGFALWMVEQNITGDIFGFSSIFSGLGVFFDTYDNTDDRKFRHPLISLVVSDGSARYSSRREAFRPLNELEDTSAMRDRDGKDLKEEEEEFNPGQGFFGGGMIKI